MATYDLGEKSAKPPESSLKSNTLRPYLCSFSCTVYFPPRLRFTMQTITADRIANAIAHIMPINQSDLLKCDVDPSATVEMKKKNEINFFVCNYKKEINLIIKNRYLP
jgi:hypothetical protein